MTDIPECIHRRFTRRPGFERLHCFLKRDDCTREECASCQMVAVERRRPFTMEIKGEQIEVGYFSEIPQHPFVPSKSPPNWVIDHSTERPDLQAIRTSLPRHRPGKDRRFTMESDGSIVYEQEEGTWEPPRDIRGYRRDSENSWRFIPLWLKCLLRFPQGHRSKNCGCIQVTMKCLAPGSELNDMEVTYEQCQQCSIREEN